MSIGVFDSGIGGLTVLKEIRKVLPNEKIYYLGDTARVPYGEKTKELIVRYSKEIVEFLLEKEVSAIVVACNTATALALKELKETFKIPIIGVIEAGARTAINTTKSNKIGVIGTKATIKSRKYEEEIRLFNTKAEVFQKACPLFVPAVEEGILSGKLVNQIIKTYLDDLKKILQKNEFLKNDAKKNEEVKYYVTDGQEKFKEIGIMFLEENISKVELVKL